MILFINFLGDVMTKQFTIGNTTTVINSIILIVAGYIFAGLAARFGNLPFTESQLAEVLGIIVFGVFSYINAKHHNTLWDDEEEVADEPIDDEEETIEDLVDKYQANDTIEVDVDGC